MLHEEFYKNITSYLTNNADIFISEIAPHSLHDDWAGQAGLKVIEYIPAYNLSQDSKTNARIVHYRYETKVH